MGKKILTYLTVVLFVLCMFAASSMAWCQSASGTHEGQAASHNYSFTRSYCGCGNDWAEAGGNGSTHGVVDISASGFLYASECGWVKGYDKTDAWSFAKDFGHTSESGAGVIIEGSITTFGEAYGFNYDKEVVDSTVTISGDIFQNNYSAELGYPQGQGIDGGRSSTALFTAFDRDYHCSQTYYHSLSDYNSISGEATVKGCTNVTIDPYGSHRSFFGETKAMSSVNIDGASRYQGIVTGNGGLGGLVQNNGTFATANANFNYTGNTSGNGGATINAQIYNGSNYSSVSVSGSSYATTH